MALVNSGYLGWTILEGIYLDNSALDGLIMPNIQQISPQAIVPDGTSITYNANSNISPIGGSDGDIWYNQPNDTLFKKIAGTWTLLTDRVLNTYYVAPVFNTTSCPIPATGATGGGV
jgi:hypothetical protein